MTDHSPVEKKKEKEKKRKERKKWSRDPICTLHTLLTYLVQVTCTSLQITPPAPVIKAPCMHVFPPQAVTVVVVGTPLLELRVAMRMHVFPASRSSSLASCSQDIYHQFDTSYRTVIILVVVNWGEKNSYTVVLGSEIFVNEIIFVLAHPSIYAYVPPPPPSSKVKDSKSHKPPPRINKYTKLPRDNKTCRKACNSKKK